MTPTPTEVAELLERAAGAVASEAVWFENAQGDKDAAILRALAESMRLGQECFELGGQWVVQQSHQRIEPAVWIIPAPKEAA